MALDNLCVFAIHDVITSDIATLTGVSDAIGQTITHAAIVGLRRIRDKGAEGP